jgi:OHCU decarboxylase
VSAYPRDLIGYGEHPPHPRWPGDARIAVQFVLNYEEGAERSVLHGDAASESFLSEMVAAQPIAGMRHMSMESLYEYGSRAGFWRLKRLFDDHAAPLTVFGVAQALEHNPDAVAGMLASNWEIASHGYRWIDNQHLPEDVERQHIAEAIAIHTRVTGTRPLGWYQGRTSPNTGRLVAEEGGFLYDADSYADDLPYFDTRHGRQQLIVPYTLDTNDMRFVAPQGFNSGDQFFAYLRDAFDVLYAEGETAPKMLSIGLHCRIAGRPARLASVRRFLEHVQSHDRVWIARRVDIARHWLALFGAGSGGLTVEALNAMGEADFIGALDGLYEHSPWVVQRAHARRPFRDRDDLHAAMTATLREASQTDRLALIRAHPELAGKAAIAGDLTDESAREQAGAGLDRLTPDEFAAFHRLNDAYGRKFGFPFIICARLNDKHSILAAMERRLGHDEAEEIEEAIVQIGEIGRLRLFDKVSA